ncbi:MAG: hypothetical protein KBS38_00860 [Bacteroidales bacterium]|nr:hypothetical protein [Candidatus Cacconaster caballi]
MRKASLLLLFAALYTGVFAQDIDFIPEMPDDFAQLDTLPRPKQFNSRHMIGVEYFYNIAGISANPDIGEKNVMCPLNFGVFYTYYHPLWDQMNIFGLKIGAKYTEEGYSTERDDYGEICRMVEFPLVSQFKLDFSRFRFLINIGTYWGYRLSTDKSGGFDKYDQRHDYGVLAGAGFGILLGNSIEFHVEGNYKFSFASMYHPNKNGEMYWITAYPRTVMISAGLYFNLW